MAQKKATAVTFPKTPGEAIDLLFKTREARLEKQREVEKISQIEKALEGHILSQFERAKLEGARGSLATATVTTDLVPKIEDWDKFIQHVVKKKDFALLHKRCAASAVAERWANEDTVPGIVSISLTKLHLSKR